MRLKKYTLLSFILFSISAVAQPKIKLDTFTRPVPNAVDIANDGFSTRLFVADQSGRIFVYDSNGIKLDTFIDIRTKVQFGGEQGLLGMAFHPNYETNGYFYVYYTKKNSNDNAVFRYKVSGNPNRAAKDSELLVINLPHPTFTNHNGGCIKFGNDGFLYISVGDGGSGGDPNNNAQNKNTILGKILRIDVNNFSTTYTIPSTNPFFNETNVRKEIWSYGLRNVWRFSFDRQTHDMWQGDVGQGAREEVNFQAANSTGGENYGWRCYEGNSSYNPAGCGNASNYVFPVFQYDHSSNGGIAITGGFVYRGNKYNDLKGYYICADYTSNNFWAIKKDGNTFTSTALGKPLTGLFMSSFGEDIRGELYATNIVNGVVYKIRELCSPFQISFSQTKNPTCYNATNGLLQISSTGNNGNVNYNWSNGGNTNQITNLAAGKYVVTATDAIGCVRKDSVTLVKPDSLNIQAVLKDPTCGNVQNGSISLSVTGGAGGTYSYQWNDGATGQVVQFLATGIYTVTVSDTNLCSTSRVYTLYNADTLDKPIVTLSNDTLYTATGFSSYQWKRNDTIINNAIQSFYKAPVPGLYSVEITDTNGCKATSDTIRFIITSIKNRTSDIQTFALFPNPATNNLTLDIRFNSVKKSTLKIVNSIGQLVYTEQLQGKEFLKTMSIQQFSKGIYQLFITTDDGQISSRSFVKE